MANITLTNSNVNSGTAVDLNTASINYSWKNLTVNKPIQHSFAATEIQFNGWENPLYSLQFIIRPNDSATNTMTWALWNDLIRQKPTSTNVTTLNITTGGLTAGGVSGSSAVFKSYAESATSTGVTNIPVVIKSCDVKFDAGDSNNGFFWRVNAVLVETT
jgi:hypothetical protein